MIRLFKFVVATALLLLAGSGMLRAADIAHTEFTLGNGLRVVVIPDSRAPVVTHTIWYRVGSADETTGKSGLAHFFEHVMFKGTTKFPAGAFDRILDENGGEKNAFTMRDVTAYYERVGADRLGLMMELEADRMQNLVLSDSDVQTELKVVQEERRQRIDSQPTALLTEQMDAAMFLAHPYGRPVIGWTDDVARLTRADAEVFYKAHYTPANATVIVVGDVKPATVKLLAEKYYGVLKNTFTPAPRYRTMEPNPIAARRIVLSDARVATPVLIRNYLAPSHVKSKSREANALALLSDILGGGSQSRLFKQLVLGQKIASTTSAWFNGDQLDSGTFGFFAAPAAGTDLAKLETSIDAILADLIRDGVTAEELRDAKEQVQASYIYALDQPASFGSLIGLGVTMGLKTDALLQRDVELASVTLDDIKAAAKTYLDIKRSVTGTLLPEGAP